MSSYFEQKAHFCLCCSVHRKQKCYSSAIHDHSWRQLLFIKYACDFWPPGNQRDDNSRQSRREPVIALVTAYSDFGESNPVQSRVQILQIPPWIWLAGYQLQVIRWVIRRVTSGHLSAAANSKTSPYYRNPVMSIVLHLENIASLGWILNCKFRPLNSQPLAVQSLVTKW